MGVSGLFLLLFPTNYNCCSYNLQLFPITLQKVHQKHRIFNTVTRIPTQTNQKYVKYSSDKIHTNIKNTCKTVCQMQCL